MGSYAATVPALFIAIHGNDLGNHPGADPFTDPLWYCESYNNKANSQTGKWDWNAGFDGKMILSTSNLDLTVNPDYSQVEVAGSR